MEVASLKKNARIATELHDKSVQTKDQASKKGEASGHAMDIDEGNLE